MRRWRRLSESPVLIAGRGHLGDRLEQQLRTTCSVVRVEPVPPGPLGSFERALDRASIATAASIYIVDDEDAANIQFTLAALKLRSDIPITMTLSNERLAPHLQQLHPNLIVRNPWEAIVPDIVKALREPATSSAASLAALPIVRAPYRAWLLRNRVLLTLAIAFVSLLAAATAFFRVKRGA